MIHRGDRSVAKMELKRFLLSIVLLATVAIKLSTSERLSQKDRLKKSGVYFYNPQTRREIPLTRLIHQSPHFYNQSQSAKILIHGWMGNRNHITIEPIKNAYLARQGNNLLIVNWSSGARQNYDLSRALVPAVAKRIAKDLREFFMFVFGDFTKGKSAF